LNIVIELGIENFPSKSLKSTLDSLEKNMLCNFSFSKKISVKGTYRRFIVDLKEVDFKEEITTKVVGPPYDLCFIEGKLNHVGEKFLLKNSCKQEDIFTDIKGEKKYIGVNKVEKISLENKLSDALEKSLTSIDFPVKMSWEGIHFLRPIRYIVAFNDNKIIKVKVGNIESSDKIKVNNRDIKVNSYADYYSTISQIKITEEARDKSVDPTVERNSVFYEAINNTENPKAVMCSFDKTFLELPYEIINKTIAVHQSGIMSGGNNFFVIAESNNDDNLVRMGNEQVVRSRLHDAKNFVEEDSKKRIEDFIEELPNISLFQGAGNMMDKQSRLVGLAKIYKNLFSLDESIVNAAQISKFDLATSVVKEKEYATLRGYIGYIYAVDRKVDENVSKLIFEHYLPRFRGDKLPSSTEGAILSILDKADNLAQFDILGKLPKGAKDPFFLRREAIGIIEILDKFDINLSVKQLLTDVSKSSGSISISNLEHFMVSRVESYMLERFDKNIVNAVIEYWDNIPDLISRAEAIRHADIASLKELYLRAFNLAKKLAQSPSVEKALLKKKEEKELYEQIEQLNQINKYKDLMKGISRLDVYLSNFFDNIIVMSEDEKTMNNRLSLLCYLVNLINKVGNIDKILRG
tara:strand:+ start:3280 stop:5184 length:1905 start_codon:yes stop_codon:yes gene_type:complete